MEYHRKSIRLDGYNYSENGYYFVTICVQNKLELFWRNDMDYIRADTSVRPYINNIGLMVDYWFNEIPNHFKNVMLDEYVIMPDHIHFILIIKNIGRTHRSARTSNQLIENVGVDRCVDPNENENVDPNKNEKLGKMIQWFKSMTTNEYIKNVKRNNWPRFDKRLWQRNYYERIIRNENEYLKIKKYIQLNPTVWDRDRNNIK